jgi:hypothetical protein
MSTESDEFIQQLKPSLEETFNEFVDSKYGTALRQKYKKYCQNATNERGRHQCRDRMATVAKTWSENYLPPMLVEAVQKQINESFKQSSSSNPVSASSSVTAATTSGDASGTTTGASATSTMPDPMQGKFVSPPLPQSYESQHEYGGKDVEAQLENTNPDSQVVDNLTPEMAPQGTPNRKGRPSIFLQTNEELDYSEPSENRPPQLPATRKSFPVSAQKRREGGSNQPKGSSSVSEDHRKQTEEKTSDSKSQGGAVAVSGGAISQPWTPQKQLSQFHKTWLTGQTSSNTKIQGDPLVSNAFTKNVREGQMGRENIFARTLAAILRKMAEAATFESSSSLREVFDWLMVYFFPFMRCNTGDALKEMMMKNPRSAGATSVAGELYEALLQSGFLPLSIQLNSPQEKPSEWVASKTHDFMSMLRQQVCVYYKDDNGAYLYFYDPRTVNEFVIPVTKGNSMEEEYLISDSTKEQEQKKLKRSGKVLLEESADNKLQHIIDKRRRELRNLVNKRTEKMMDALEYMRKDLGKSLPGKGQLKTLIQTIYKANGVDVDTGEVHENLSRWLKKNPSLEQKTEPLMQQKEAIVLGVNKQQDQNRYRALDYYFRVVPKISNWPVKDVWNNAKPDNAWSIAMYMKDVLRAIRSDINEVRIKARDSL